MTLLLTISVMAQESTEPSAPPDLVIVEKNWRKQLVDPNRDNNESRYNEDLARFRKAQEAYLNELRANPDQPTVSNRPTFTATKPVTPGWQMLNIYTYMIKVENTGAKTIKLIAWEYQFLDPATQQLKEQRKLTNRVKLSPGKSQVIECRLTRQPTIVVNANQIGRKYRDQFTERAIITEIVYTDGSVWRRPKN
jgi:hypothetical protein